MVVDCVKLDGWAERFSDMAAMELGTLHRLLEDQKTLRFPEH